MLSTHVCYLNMENFITFPHLKFKVIIRTLLQFFKQENRLDEVLFPVKISLSKLREIVEDRGVWWAAVHKFAESQA